MSDNVDLTLSHDEALVLSDLLARYEQTDKLTLTHNAEYLALSRLSALLDKALVEPFDPNYSSLVSHARERLAAGFEGPAPGVNGGGA
ncbi:hypothetical protein [Thermomonas fusca]